MKFKVKLLLTGLFAGATVYGQDIKTDNLLKTHLDSLVHEAATNYLQKPHTFDLAIGVYSTGTSHEYNYHKGSGPLPTGKTYYGIGSVAKTFAGWMLANALVEKKMKLNDDIRKYLPGKYPNLEYKGHPVHIADLASHTSAMPGLSKDYSDKFMESLTKSKPETLSHFFEEYTADSLFSDMHHFKLDTIPGTKYHYNGNAIMVLIAILQRVYHRPYPELISAYLKQHYNMLHTRTQLTKAEEREILQGHDETGKVPPLVIDKGFRAAPTMLSTPDDMLKFVKANLDKKDPVTSLSHQVTFTKPDGMQLGLNWMMGKEDNGFRYIMHTGRDGFGFTALCFMYPDQQAGIVIMVNDSTGEDSVSELKDVIVAKMFN
nr:serine hydrolase domain-containing protein [Pedobacter sp. ASV19]